MKYIYRKEAGYWIFFNKLKIKITNKRRNALAGYMFISIWLIGFIVLAAYPLIRSLIFSFQKVTISGAQGILTVGVGFNNYLTIFTQDLEFLRMIQEFVFEMILYVPIILTIAMIIAMMLNQKIKLRGFFRAIYFLPVVIASGPVINELLNQGAGSVPIIEDLGMLEVLSGFLPMVIARPLSSLFSEMIMILWFSGVQIVLFLAGLQKLSKEIYEAAEIDGASPWEKFWKITLPSLKSIIFVSAIYTIVMLATFSNNEIITYIQSSGVMFSSDKGYGYASTLAWIYFIVIVVLLVITALVLGNKREKKEKR
ncbi:MAG TPA: sugar ABC transporter permease [Acholeplasma sp.]|jgi:ABC-type sugar transport system permease subunit|nr:sugar ABC transporter permease [Acholeplasma sp.]